MFANPTLSLSLSLSLLMRKDNHLCNIFRCWTNQKVKAFNLIINLV